MSAVTTLTAIGALNLAAMGLQALVARRQGDGPGTVDWDVSHRSGGRRPAYQGSAIQPRVLPVIIKPTAPMTPAAWDDATDAVLAEVDGRTADDPLVLTGPHMSTGATLEMPVAVESIELAGGAVFLSVLAADPFWRTTEPTTVTATFSTAVGSMTVTVPGGAPVRPTVTIRPTGQRTAGNAVAGMKWSRSGSVTNTADAPLVRYPLRIALGDTGPLVTAGKLRSDFNDLRVWIDGADVPREVVVLSGTPASTFVWIVVPYLEPGGTLPFALLYGNTNVAPAPRLVYPDLPPFSLAAARSSNHRWEYDVARTAANERKGGWHLAAGAGNAVAFADVDVPGAWRRARTLPRAENADDVSQPLWSEYSIAGATHRQAIFDTRLYRSGAANLPDEGLADGVEIDIPVGITAVRAGFYWISYLETTGTAPVGKLMVLARNAAGNDFLRLYEDARVSTFTIAPTTWTLPTPQRRVAFAVWPRDETAVPEYVGFDRYAQARWDAELHVLIDGDKLAFGALGVEMEVVEIAARIDAGGHALFVGSGPSVAGRLDPTPGGKLALGLAGGGAKIVVDGETRSATVVAAGATSGPEAPVAAVDASVAVNGGSRPAVDWLPLSRGTNQITVTQEAPAPIEVTVTVRPGYS